MNRSLETLLRFVNLTASGLLAGSLGFGESALTPGWENERPRQDDHDPEPAPAYFNAIGPVALATAMTLAIAARCDSSARRTLDVVSTLGLAGVLAATMLVTVPINKRLQLQAPIDYPSDDTQGLARNWNRAHSIRTALGVTAFVCAVASNVAFKRRD
jgi:Domain of unknown function (DUF1772).